MRRLTAPAVDVEALDARGLLAHAVERFGADRIAVACSFQKEASAILDLLLPIAPDVHVFTLDTGVLFEETHAVWRRIEERYAIRIEGLRGTWPDRLWETDQDACCHARKVVPMRDRLKGYDAWITGLRRDQSPERADTPKLSWDDKHGLWKVCPLADWSDGDVWTHIMANDVPYHALHDRGYASIGCVPCTAPGEGRAGRWAGTEKTECGLHAPEAHVPEEESAWTR